MDRSQHGFVGIGRTAVAICLGVLGASGCAALGYSDRVLWRVPAPDGDLVAVCQETPEFDGPGYDVRLERPDRTLVRRLYSIGDGDPCSEVVWSPDGNTLAVLSGHVARVRFVDVEWTLAHPEIETAYWSWRQVDLSADSRVEGSGLRFVGPRDVELRVCTNGATGTAPSCDATSPVRRFAVPLPIVTGH
jgi:hypothetical protein